MHKVFLNCAKAIPALLLLTIIGCSKSDEPEAPPEQPVEITGAVVFEPLGTGFAGTLTDTTEAVYHSLDDWYEVAEQLTPLKDFPAIDESQMIVLLAAVPTPTGGYSVEFVTAETTEEEIIVTYELSVPGYDCITTAGLSLAFQAATIPKTDLPIRFVRNEKYYSCST